MPGGRFPQANRAHHGGACSDRRVRGSTKQLSQVTNTRSEIENFTDPDAYVVTDTFFITHTQTRSVRFFDKECSGNEYFQAQVVLPSGVDIVATETELVRNTATNLPLLSSSMSNDTLTLVFDAFNNAGPTTAIS